MISFNVPPYVGKELDYIRDAVEQHRISGNGKYTKLCSSWMEETFHSEKILLTTSGSAALDMAALLCNL